MTNIKEKITSKPTKTILFAGLLVTILIPFSTMGYVEADNIKGKTIIKFEKSDSDIPLWEERKHLREVYSQLESESDKALTQKKIDQLSVRISQWYAERFDGDMYNLAREKQDLLGDVLREERQEVGREAVFEALPWTTRGYDYVDNALEVTIMPEAFTEDNIPKYIHKIRSIVGDEVNLTISPQAAATLDTCTDRDTTVCDPMKGGVEVQIGNNVCTVGFAATFDSNEGFVTAGHCNLNNGASVAVEQPASDTTDLGDVQADEWFDGSDCDCLFVDSSRDMDDGVFGMTDPVTTANPFVNMDVTLSGVVSGISSGDVLDIDEDIDYDTDGNMIPDTEIQELIVADYARDGGDSGGPIMSGNSLIGIHSGGNDSAGEAYFTKHSQFTEHFSGLSWGF